MTKQQVEDLVIGFDEYGFEPTTLCDSEVVIKQYQLAFKEMIKDYEILEILKKHIFIEPESYENQAQWNHETIFFSMNSVWTDNKEEYQKVKDWILNER